MSDKQNIVYVIEYIDNEGHANIPYKKIGITGAGNATLSERLAQLQEQLRPSSSDTIMPIQLRYLKVWSHDKASEIEDILHDHFDDVRSVGEWFIDKDNNLIDKIMPIMKEQGAKEENIEYYNNHMKIIREEKNKEKNKILLKEVIDCLPSDLQSLDPSPGVNDVSRIPGNQSRLTFYVHRRSSEYHHLSIGRINSEISKSNNVSEQLKEFLTTKGFKWKMWGDEVAVKHLKPQQIANIIKVIEAEFKPSLEETAKSEPASK